MRAVFAPKLQDFAKIITYTFFFTPDEKRKTFTIPEEFVIPANIIEAAKDTGMVEFFIDSFKLSTEEGEVLNIAYQSHTIKELYPVFNEMVNHGEENRLSFQSVLVNPLRTLRQSFVGIKNWFLLTLWILMEILNRTL